MGWLSTLQLVWLQLVSYGEGKVTFRLGFPPLLLCVQPSIFHLLSIFCSLQKPLEQAASSSHEAGDLSETRVLNFGAPMYVATWSINLLSAPYFCIYLLSEGVSSSKAETTAPGSTSSARCRGYVNNMQRTELTLFFLIIINPVASWTQLLSQALKDCFD